MSRVRQLIAVAVIVFAVSLFLLVPPATSQDPGQRSVGEQYAQELGLEPITIPAGAQLRWGQGPLSDCQPGTGPGFLVEASENIAYCAVGLTEDPIESWVIARRLQGSVPSEQEVDRYRQVLQESGEL